MPFLFIGMVLAASLARVFLGVHYPSDCVWGALQGALISLIGTLLWNADLLGCESCHQNACYAELGGASELTISNLGDMSWFSFSIVAALSLVLAIVMVVPPISFWRKCDRALG